MNLRTNSLLRPLCRTAAAVITGAAILVSATSAYAATPYKANEGDTLWSVSQKFGITVDELINLNKSVSANNIYDGLTLSIPAAASNKTTSKTDNKSKSVMKMSEQKSGAQIIDPNGTSFSVAKTMNIKATAYSSDISENGKWGAVDCLGNPLKLGTVAVDPKLIPLGTKLYVTGYDFNGLPKGGMMATATDTGGKIKGERIDIFVPGSMDEVNNFGIQYVKVHILQK